MLENKTEIHVSCPQCHLVSIWDIAKFDIDGDVIKIKCPGCSMVRNIFLDASANVRDVTTLSHKLEMGQVYKWCNLIVMLLRVNGDHWQCMVLKDLDTSDTLIPREISLYNSHFTKLVPLDLSKL